MKDCSKCSINKPFDRFYKVGNVCKDCKNDYYRLRAKTPIQKEKNKVRGASYRLKNSNKIATLNQEWRNENKERLSVYRAEKRKANLDTVREKERVYYANNKDYLTEKQKENRDKNLELYRQTNKDWYAKNKDWVRPKVNAYRRGRSEHFAELTKNSKLKNIEYYKTKDAERIKNITDGYIIGIVASSIGLAVEYRKLIPQEMINLKRLNIQLKRELKNKK